MDRCRLTLDSLTDSCVGSFYHGIVLLANFAVVFLCAANVKQDNGDSPPIVEKANLSEKHCYLIKFG